MPIVKHNNRRVGFLHNNGNSIAIIIKYILNSLNEKIRLRVLIIRFSSKIDYVDVCISFLIYINNNTFQEGLKKRKVILYRN